MNARESKATFILVGAMFAAVWAVTAWLAMAFIWADHGKVFGDTPRFLLPAMAAQGIIFSSLCAALLIYRVQCGGEIDAQSHRCSSCGMRLPGE